MKVRIEGQPLNSVLGIKSRYVGNGGDECSVEELALQHYAAEAGGSWTGQLMLQECCASSFVHAERPVEGPHHTDNAALFMMRGPNCLCNL